MSSPFQNMMAALGGLGGSFGGEGATTPAPTSTPFSSLLSMLPEGSPAANMFGMLGLRPDATAPTPVTGQPAISSATIGEPSTAPQVVPRPAPISSRPLSQPIGDPVAADLPPHQRAFLNATARGESNGQYNLRYSPKGGQTFTENDAHPAIREQGPSGPSDAAGRYQFLSSTWKDIGGKEFTRDAQDRNAWKLAERDYMKRTGRSLDTDLQQQGFTPQIQKVLAPTWTALGKDNGGNQREYDESLKRYQPSTKVAQNTHPVTGKPIVPQEDGTIATEKTIDIEVGGKHILIPTIINGRQVPPETAIKLWEQGVNPEVGSADSREQLNPKGRSNMLGAQFADQPPENDGYIMDAKPGTLQGYYNVNKLKGDQQPSLPYDQFMNWEPPGGWEDFVKRQRPSENVEDERDWGFLRYVEAYQSKDMRNSAIALDAWRTTLQDRGWSDKKVNAYMRTLLDGASSPILTENTYTTTKGRMPDARRDPLPE